MAEGSGGAADPDPDHTSSRIRQIYRRILWRREVAGRQVRIPIMASSRIRITAKNGILWRNKLLNKSCAVFISL